MSLSSGRAYVFLRWSGSPFNTLRLGDVAWAFENNDRLGRFNCFYCGATESGGAAPFTHPRTFWHEKCFTLPELIKAMSYQGPERPGYEEVKVFEVSQANADLALQVVAQRSGVRDDIGVRIDPLEETREILTRYGVRGLASTKGFSAPFLWYNMLPGRSVALRKLAVHLFEIRVARDNPASASPEEVEDEVRRVALEIPGVLNLGECFVGRSGPAFLVGLNVDVSGQLSVAAGHSIAERVEEAIRGKNSKIQHVFVHVQPAEELE